MINREEMISRLAEGVCLVEFTKKDGDKRLMECTLDMNMIPENQRPASEIKSRSENNISVWDVQANGWRSFVVANVINFGTDVKSV